MSVFSKTMAFRSAIVASADSSAVCCPLGERNLTRIIGFPVSCAVGCGRKGLMKVNIYASGLVTRLGTGNHHFRGAPWTVDRASEARISRRASRLDQSRVTLHHASTGGLRGGRERPAPRERRQLGDDPEQPLDP